MFVLVCNQTREKIHYRERVVSSQEEDYRGSNSEDQYLCVKRYHLSLFPIVGVIIANCWDIDFLHAHKMIIYMPTDNLLASLDSCKIDKHYRLSSPPNRKSSVRWLEYWEDEG